MSFSDCHDSSKCLSFTYMFYPWQWVNTDVYTTYSSREKTLDLHVALDMINHKCESFIRTSNVLKCFQCKQTEIAPGLWMLS